MNEHIAEIVTFRLAPGISEADFLNTVPATSAFVAKLDGFIRRRLSRDTQGNWHEFIEWENLAKAEAASRAFMAQEKLMPMMRAIDEASMKLSHHSIAVSIG